MALDQFEKKTESKVRIKGPHFKKKRKDEIRSHSPINRSELQNQMKDIDKKKDSKTDLKENDTEEKMNVKEDKKAKKENIVATEIKEKKLKERTLIGEEEVQNSSESNWDNPEVDLIQKNCSNLKSSLKEVAFQTQKMADNLDNLINNTEELKSNVNISSDFESEVQASKSEVEAFNEEKKEEVEEDNLDSSLNQGLLDKISLDKLSIVIILHILLQRFFTDSQGE